MTEVALLSTRLDPSIGLDGSLSPASVDAAELKTAMRAVAGGVSVITAGRPGNRTGATVTSATAFSMEPPTMIVAINLSSSTWPVIAAERHFCVNILRDDQHRIADRFSGFGGVKGEMRYEGAAWTTLASGAPALGDAVTVIDCVVDESIERYTHGLVLGRVVAIKRGDGLPLVYSNGRYGGFA
jgi:flavin reductase (DIM6/NTAB) family NADH-FMN oxidoreductase RutF